MTSHSHTNRLAQETSPYLLQHAHNPVDWYPWGSEAFEAAAAQNKPILLSVGYSACHWCHVMERESFENEAIAALMNRDFINIKVDREGAAGRRCDLHDRRPDADRPGRLADDHVSYPAGQTLLWRHLLSRLQITTDARISARSRGGR